MSLVAGYMVPHPPLIVPDIGKGEEEQILETTLAWLAPDRLGEFCGMVEHICGIFGEYREIARQRAAELRERFGL